MKSFGLFVLFATLIAFSSAAFLKNTITNNEEKKKKKKKSKGPKGPDDRSDWNEVPFAKSNIKFIEEGSMIEIDNTKIFAANYTFPYQTTYHQLWNTNNFVMKGQDWNNLPNYDYNFENDCTLARLKISFNFPSIYHYYRGGFFELGLFLDGERISSSSHGYYNERGIAMDGWHNPTDNMILSGTVFNVLSKSHKIEAKYKSTYYFGIDQEFWAGVGRDSYSNKFAMDLWSPPKVNLNMFGECIKYKDYNGK
jgi:hypothetical protein